MNEQLIVGAVVSVSDQSYVDTFETRVGFIAEITGDSLYVSPSHEGDLGTWVKASDVSIYDAVAEAAEREAQAAAEAAESEESESEDQADESGEQDADEQPASEGEEEAA